MPQAIHDAIASIHDPNGSIHHKKVAREIEPSFYIILLAKPLILC